MSIEETTEEVISITMRLPKSLLEKIDSAAMKVGYTRSARFTRSSYIREVLEDDVNRVLNSDDQKNQKLF